MCPDVDAAPNLVGEISQPGNDEQNPKTLGLKPDRYASNPIRNRWTPKRFTPTCQTDL
jgi:hypothetical protein